jgi:hypothetical protein
MADAARGVRQLVLAHGRNAACEMVASQDDPLVRIKDFVGAIHTGINIIHVNTELRVASGIPFGQ